jgi:hypothetical protein
MQQVASAAGYSTSEDSTSVALSDEMLGSNDEDML